MDNQEKKSIKKLKNKGIKIKLETIIEEETINKLLIENEKTIKPILICNSECKKCIDPNCI